LREIHAKDGGVVLMHAIYPKAADLVRAAVPVLQQQEGYKFARLDQMSMTKTRRRGSLRR
jgi:hypothetical protein